MHGTKGDGDAAANAGQDSPALPKAPLPEHGRKLRSHFLVLLACAGIPVMLLVMALGWRDYTRTTTEVIEQHLRAQQVRRVGLEQIVGTVRTHIAVLRGYAERRLQETGNLPPYDSALDWLGGASPADPGLGLIMSPPGRATAGTRREVMAVEPLAALSRATQREHPFLRWSYYFSNSRGFIEIYPWAPTSQMVGETDPVGTFDGYFAYDVFKLGEPERNQAHEPYWTPVYLDAGGAGLMVSHGAPVWVGTHFAGIVGTDVLLSYLSDYLSRFPSITGKIVVADQVDNVVAMEGGVPALGDKAAKVGDILPNIGTDLTGGRFVRQGRDYVSVVPIAGTPWRLIMTLPDAAIAAAVWSRIWPHALMLGGIFFTLAFFTYLFHSRFVGPAVALAEYGALSAAEAKMARLPEVPNAWKHLRDRIAIAFREQIALVHQLRSMIDGIPLRAVYVDPDYRYRDANREFLDFIGKSNEELVGLRVGEVLGENVEDQYVGLTPTIRRGEVARWEGWIDYVGQGSRYVQVSILPFTALGETQPGFLTFTRDLTELKQAEQEAARNLGALAESEALHRSIVTSSLDAIIVIDERGLTREFNPAAEAIFGYAAAEAIGKPIGDLIVPANTRQMHHDGLANYLKGGPARVIGRRIEVEALHKNGEPLPVELTVTEVTMGGRRLFTSHIRDLREQKRLALELEQGRNRLHQVEKLSAMGSLLAGVAHELNNPLAIVIAQSALLLEKAESEDVKRRGERIRAAADRCGRIVKSFLAMARQKPPVREPVDLNEVVRNSLEMVGYGLRSAGIEVASHLAEGLPPVAADADLMSQVVSNIVINAQHALLERPLPRRITISSRHEIAAESGGAVVLEIADNGPGVAAEIAQRIFDPYFTTKTAGVGTGIGLSISRDIIQAHGGEIALLAAPGGGAIFQLRIPVTLTTGLDAMASEAPAADDGRLEILIVDDEPDVGQSLAEMLELLGHRPTLLTNSAAALEHIAKRKTDILFTDLRMPGLDGAAIIERIAASHPLLAKRSIIVTGDSFAGPNRIAALGRTDLVVIEKPFDLEGVRQALAKVIAAT